VSYSKCGLGVEADAGFLWLNETRSFGPIQYRAVKQDMVPAVMAQLADYSVEKEGFNYGHPEFEEGLYGAELTTVATGKNATQWIMEKFAQGSAIMMSVYPDKDLIILGLVPATKLPEFVAVSKERGAILYDPKGGWENVPVKVPVKAGIASEGWQQYALYGVLGIGAAAVLWAVAS